MKRNWKSFMALLLVCALVIAVPGVIGPARAVNLDAGSCSLTVNPCGNLVSEAFDDLLKASADGKVSVDVYQVASAAEMPGVDAYTFEAAGDFAALTIGENNDSTAWDALAQAAAGIALQGETPVEPAATALMGTKIENLDPGLYLVIARNTDVTDVNEYVKPVKDEEGSQRIATVVNTDEHSYYYAPALVALPTKGAVDVIDPETGEPTGETVINTANAGEWIYDAEVDLKPEQEELYGSLRITKRLEGYAPGSVATFVFRIEAWVPDKDAPNARRVFSGVREITFTGEGTKSVVVEHLPVGATVYVYEDYSGVEKLYTVVGEAEQTVVIEDPEIPAEVEFVNDSIDDNPQYEGGAIINRFTYEENPNGRTEPGWAWTPILDIENA